MSTTFTEALSQAINDWNRAAPEQRIEACRIAANAADEAERRLLARVPRITLAKVAWIRDPNAPIGQPATGHLHCPCGNAPESRFEESNGNVECACGTVSIAITDG